MIQTVSGDHQDAAKDRDPDLGNVAGKSVTLKRRKEDAPQSAGHQADDTSPAMKAKAPHQFHRKIKNF